MWSSRPRHDRAGTSIRHASGHPIRGARNRTRVIKNNSIWRRSGKRCFLDCGDRGSTNRSLGRILPSRAGGSTALGHRKRAHWTLWLGRVPVGAFLGAADGALGAHAFLLQVRAQPPAAALGAAVARAAVRTTGRAPRRVTVLLVEALRREGAARRPKYSPSQQRRHRSATRREMCTAAHWATF